MSTSAAPAATGTGPFYGWRVLSVMFASQMVAVGGVTYPYSLFLKPIEAELGASRAQLSWGMIGLMIVLMAAGPFVGRALDRHSIRHIVAAGGLLMGTGFGLMSISPSLLPLALCFWIPVGLGHFVAGPPTASKLVAAWFARRRGLALGISAVGTSAGGFVAPPLVAAAIAAWGWRGALVAIGLVSLIVVPAALAVIVNRPQDIGLRPDGDPPLDGERAAPAPELWSIRRALTHPAYWGLALGFGGPIAIGAGLLSFLHAYGTDQGLSASAAAWMISLLSGASVAGKLLFGALADRIPTRALAWTGIAFQAAFLWVLMAQPSAAILLAAAVIGGLSFGGLLPLQGVMIAAAFGPASFASVIGLMGLVITPLLIAAFWISGFMYSEEHGYEPVLQLLLFGSAIAAAALLLVRPGATSPELQR